MSTKRRSWNVNQINRSAPNVSADPESPMLDVRSAKTRIGKVEAVASLNKLRY